MVPAMNNVVSEDEVKNTLYELAVAEEDGVKPENLQDKLSVLRNYLKFLFAKEDENYLRLNKDLAILCIDANIDNFYGNNYHLWGEIRQQIERL